MQKNEASVSGTESLALDVEAVLREANPVIRFKAYRLTRRLRGAPVSQQDIEAELQLHLISQLKRFDRARGQLSTFINCVLDRRCISITRYWRALKRTSSREELSLQEEIRDGEGNDVRRTETTVELGRDPWPRTDMAHDLNAVISELPPDQREAIARLRKGESIPKQQRLSIKKHLEDKGLDKYFE